MDIGIGAGSVAVGTAAAAAVIVVIGVVVGIVERLRIFERWAAIGDVQISYWCFRAHLHLHLHLDWHMRWNDVSEVQ